MISHPLVLAVMTADLLAVLLVAGAAATAFRVALRWEPEDTSAAQLRLQTRWETSSLAVAWSAGLFFCATAVWVVAITTILPGLVPGAMCGTGVLQAMQTAGPRLLIYRLAAMGLLWIWWRLESVNQAHPEAPLVPVVARWVLVILPVMGLALHASWQAVLAMELQQPVDCCAVIYDRFRTPDDARRTLGAGPAFWSAIFAGTSAVVVLLALGAWKRPFRRRRHLLLGLTVFVWLPVAAITLVRVLAAYHYGVLHHHCPWCLFLGAHGGVGFPLWAAWMLAALEAASGMVLSSCGGRRFPMVSTTAGRRAAGAARNTLWAIVFFLLLSTVPALWWRVQFGMWMTG